GAVVGGAVERDVHPPALGGVVRGVAPRAALERVRAVAARERVVAGAAVERVRAGIAAEHVIARATGDVLVARENVGLGRAGLPTGAAGGGGHPGRAVRVTGGVGAGAAIKC